MALSIKTTSSWKRLAAFVVVIEILGAGLFFFWQSQANAESVSVGGKESSASALPASATPAPLYDSLLAMPGASVLVATIRTDTLAGHGEIIGTAHAGNEIHIVSETQGRVVKILAEQGVRLQSGAPIALIDATLKESTLKLAKATYIKAQKDHERFVQLHKERTATAVELEQYALALANAEYQLAIAQRQLDDATIRTPIAGILTERMISNGSMVQPGMAVAMVLDMATMKIKAQVSEQDAFRIKIGQTMHIKTDVYPQAHLQGHVKFLSLKADQAHTYTMEIHCVNSSQYPLRAGQNVRVQYALPTRFALMVPRSALVGTSTERSVYVLAPNSDIPAKRVVGIGESIGAMVEITSGLHTGETIVTSGAQTLRPNMKVQVQK
jgi:RND family efflux transporter MFP subunit